MKPTDEERREVARRLRDNADESRRWVVPWAVFNDADEHGDIEVHNRLADLIEPEPERTCRLRETDHEYETSYRCDACRRVVWIDWKGNPRPRYCPNCGSKVVSE